ncbi:GNAT family N-acetyltransferase [Rhodospirillum centenum]|uniref:Acetyltransferase, GNAT family n=1 Tax=Rhodospirillum centenum (strain ATCC 51521 / SW) TaxID=414684 RepID=B6IYA6_RHOCS|nr:GNAT family N-acetyltransferase [Rhodospirillum centenum]ACJ01280.1 acetyltransferase, GNAT family [Rhodospirillum centenum SW]
MAAPDRTALLADTALLEDLGLTAWPALKTVHHDGWLLRFSGGHTGRANSVTVIAPGVLPLAEKIAFAAAQYRAHGLTPLFRTTPLCPDGLEKALTGAGFARQGDNAVQVLDALPAELPAATAIAPLLEEGWLRAWLAMVPVPERELPFLRAILAAIPMPCLYATAWEKGQAAAVALGVVDRGRVGVFKVATRPDLRGRGHGGRAVRAVLAAARREGARGAYLQVGCDNAPANRLYARLGFSNAYGYSYWRPAAVVPAEG